MKKRPLILITNDDGVTAPGIRHLWNSLKEIADLVVVAPSQEQSGVGLSFSMRQPLRIEKISWDGADQIWSVSGTPADCVKLALNVVLPKLPDLVVSGINRGSNAGRTLLYSGTVGGVIEGVMHDIPGIAFSCFDYATPNYQQAEEKIASVVNYVLAHPLPRGTLLNVNFPSRNVEQFKGLKFARQGQSFWAEDPDQRDHPSEGHSYYWIGAKFLECEEHEESDIRWLEQGYMTAVPVHVGELTDHRHFDAQKDHFNQFFLS